jgi:hypothetical protein
MKKLKILSLSMLLPVLTVLISCTSCEKSNDNSGPEEAYVIGYDPCTVIYDTTENAWVGSQGYIVTLSERKDTVLTYNLPDTLFDFPHEYFCFPCEGSFPRSEWKTYKMMIDYEYVEEDERFFAICLAIIPSAWIDSVTDRGTQIKIKHATR